MSDEEQIQLVSVINNIILVLREVPPHPTPLSIYYFHVVSEVCRLFLYGYGLLHNLPDELATPLRTALEIEGARISPTLKD